MAKKEAKIDIKVSNLLTDVGIKFTPQGSDIKEINDALKTASKNGKGNVGFPEFVALVKDFVLVIEDKPDYLFHVYKENDIVGIDNPSIVEAYAMNGALWYAKHIARNTNFKKVFAFGISDDGKNMHITPMFVDDREYCVILDDVQTFYNFTEENIEEYYTREVLKEETDVDLENEKLISLAGDLHEDLRNYGNLQNKDKPLVVSGILLALQERQYGTFNISNLTGDTAKTDGDKIFDAIASNLQRSRVAPEVKKNKILSQFRIIKNSEKLNEINDKLGKTPLKYYTEFLDEHIYKPITNLRTTEDYLGRFYGEFMSYGDNDGQSLGIILTPRHITDLFCDLVDLKRTDYVLDPCCGTAGFLITAMSRMFQQTIEEKKLKANDLYNDADIRNIRENQLHGIELQDYMFTIATTNMILRGDGKSNLVCQDFLKQKPSELQLKQCNVGMMNPPYSQGSKENPDLYEISFIEHLLNSITRGGKVAVIVPQSTMTGKTTDEQNAKERILKSHTLEGTIMLNKDTFYGVGVIPCIAVFTAGIPHPKDKICKFINFENDGYKVSPHVGLIETEVAKDNKQHLLDVWNDRVDDNLRFVVKTSIEADDEWLHSFYYFNDEIPTDEDFDKTIADYLTFEFNMISHGKGYLFEDGDNND